MFNIKDKKLESFIATEYTTDSYSDKILYIYKKNKMIYIKNLRFFKCRYNMFNVYGYEKSAYGF